MPWTPPTIGEVAAEVAALLEEPDEAMAMRVSLRFVEHFDNAAEEERKAMVATAPSPTGEQRFDALLAGLVEFCCASNEMLPPRWVNEDRFFLPTFWFPAGIRALEAEAFVWSPASLKRHGVFVGRGALSYA